MAVEPRFLSIRAYARAREASEATIRYHVSKGTIVLDKRGQVDPEQADAAWARRRHQSRSNPGARTASARIRKAQAKLAMAQDALAKLDAEYAPRDAAIAQYGREGAYVLDALRAMPAIEAEAFAIELGIPPAQARKVLDDFVQLCLDDIGDLGAQLTGLVARV
jgi:hypothetical protein